MLENLGDDSLLDKFYELQKLIEDREYKLKFVY
jgi:hypothetical protein